MKQAVDVESLVASSLQFLLNWNATGVVKGIWLIAIVVRLNKKPIEFAQFVEGMNRVNLSLNDHSFVCSHSRNDVIDWATDSLSFESFDCRGVIGLFLKNFSEEPNSWDSIVKHHADQIVVEVLHFPGVDIDSKRTLTDASECKCTSDDCIYSIENLSSLGVFNISNQLCKNLPHFKIQVAAMEHLPIRIANKHSRASLEGGELVHEVEEEDFVEGDATQHCDGIYLSHEVLIFEFVLGVPLNVVVESGGDWQQIHKVNEPQQWFFEVLDDGRPTHERRIFNCDAVDYGRMGYDREHMWHHCGCDIEGQNGKEDQLHIGIIINSVQSLQQPFQIKTQFKNVPLFDSAELAPQQEKFLEAQSWLLEHSFSLSSLLCLF